MKCLKCGKTFGRTDRYESHLKKCSTPKGFKCKYCGKIFHQKCRYEAHVEKATKCVECPQTFCSRIMLERHRRTDHEGQGLVFEHEQNESICPDSGHSQTQAYQDFVAANYNKIGSFVNNSTNRKVVNREIPANYTYTNLKDLLNEIRNQETTAFKINLGFGSILYDIVNKTYRYYYVSSNHLLFAHAFTISTYADMDNFYEKILALDLANNYYMKRPSSSWTLVSLPNIEIQIFRLRNIPIGAPIQLPDFIKNKRAIIGLTRDNCHGHLYDDNLCLFRAIAYHKKKTLKGLETLTNELLDEAEQVTQNTFEKGVEVNSLAEIEMCFGVNINVYKLQENGNAEVVRLSNLNFKDVINLNIYENHFSYIKNMKSYTKKYQCNNCNRVLNRGGHLKRHVNTCNQEQSEIYRGGIYSNSSKENQ